MSSTPTPSLHRFVARNALETTAFGYEVLAPNQNVDECIATVQWADCWCPDAAQFVLIQAPVNLTAVTASTLIRAFGDSDIRLKLRLLCTARILEDEHLLTLLRGNEIGFLLQTDGRGEIESMATKGILGVHVSDATALTRSRKRCSNPEIAEIVRTAHHFGLRSIASQVSKSALASELLALGVDYVSLRDGGFVPEEPSFTWLRRVV